MGPRCPRSQYVRSRFFITRCLLVVVASGVNYQGGLFILVYNNCIIIVFKLMSLLVQNVTSIDLF